MKYYKVKYEVAGTPHYLDGLHDFEGIAHNIAIGQSIGNPNVRSEIENSKNVKEFQALVDNVDYREKTVTIKFPLEAFTWPNISQLLCIIQGGQSDIGEVKKCRVVDIEGLPYMNKPILGLKEFKERVGAENRPLLGSIIKPKSGLNANQLESIVEQMIDGGTDFIKEDEILADNDYLPVKKRVEVISKLIERKKSKVVYSYCINADPIQLIDNLANVSGGGGDCVHINFWSGLGAYTASNSLGLITHYQRSGIRILTDKSNNFSLSWPVLAKLGVMAGIDTMHVGMIGGYYPADEVAETKEVVDMLVKHNRTPALSCGMTPEIAQEIRNEIGNDWMANVGGYLHSGESIYHQVKGFRDSLDG
jgi:ribulose-bisphosphate carboxylase large chain